MVRITRRGQSTRRATVPGLRGANPYLRGAPGLIPRMLARSAARRRPAASRRHLGGPSSLPRQINIAPGVGGLSAFSKRFRPDRRALTIEKVGSINQYTYNRGFRLPVSTGFQNAAAFNIATNVDLQLLMSKTVPTNLFLNQFVLRNATSTLAIANNSTAACHLDIYDIVYKRNTPLGLITSNNTQYNLVDAASLWAAGMEDQDVNHSTTAYQNLMVLPSASRFYRDYTVVLKKRRMLLAAGATHEHRVRLSYNKLISTDLIGSNGAGANGNNQVFMIQNLGYTTLIVAYGTPVSGANEGNPFVSTAPLAIDCVQQTQYDYTWVKDGSNTWTVQDNLVSIPTVNNITPAYFNGTVVSSM